MEMAVCSQIFNPRSVQFTQRPNLSFRFIIDGIITMPIALYGFLVFPDLPRTTQAFYLSQEAYLSIISKGFI